MVRERIRVLIIEDEQKVADFIQKGLQQEGYAVDVARDVQEGAYQATDYQQLVKLGQPSVERAKADFRAAVEGGDEEKYHFALGIQTIAATVPAGTIPGVTKDMNEKMLRSCLDIFKYVASRSHAGAAFMVADFEAYGLGMS